MKEKSIVPSVLLVIAIGLVLFLIYVIIVWGSWGHGQDNPDPSLNLSELTQAVCSPGHGERAPQIEIENNVYEATPYVNATMAAKEEFPTSLNFGATFAYGVHNDQIYYYAEIKGLSTASWIAGFFDDGIGIATTENIEAIYKAVDETAIPDWIEAAKEASENSISPGSYQGLKDGYTIIK